MARPPHPAEQATRTGHVVRGTWTKLLGWPLFGAGGLSLAAGLGTSAYWPMALGLVAMAIGALRATDLGSGQA